MKFNSLNTVFAMTALVWLSNTIWAEEECTFGKLYLSEVDSTTVHIFDMNGSPGNSITEEASIVVGGGPQIFLEVDSSNTVVSSIFRGTAPNGFLDGAITWINTAVYKEDHGDHFHVEQGTPSMINNAAFNCSRPGHYVRANKKIAIFCDGLYDFTPQINTTVWVIDETKFNSPTESAIVYSATLQGTHHGVAIPVDDNHLLHSLASPARINRNSRVSSPDTFQVVDNNGMVLHGLTDTSNKDMSCSGFHGSWSQGSTSALACDSNHGGILMVNYDENAKTYTSRAIMYPPSFATGHRTGDFTEYSKSPYVLGDFAIRGQAHLMAFKPTDTVLTSANIQTLPLRQCAFSFEMSEAKLVMVFMPNGMLHAFTIDPWTEVAKVQVVPIMSTCPQAIYVPGFMRSYIVHPATKTVYTVDLLEAAKGIMKVSSAALPFTPLAGVVAGVPEGTACLSNFKAPDPVAPPTSAPATVPVAVPKAAPVLVPTPAVAPVPVAVPVAPTPVVVPVAPTPVVVPVAPTPVAVPKAAPVPVPTPVAPVPVAIPVVPTPVVAADPVAAPKAAPAPAPTLVAPVLIAVPVAPTPVAVPKAAPAPVPTPVAPVLVAVPVAPTPVAVPKAAPVPVPSPAAPVPVTVPVVNSPVVVLVPVSVPIAPTPVSAPVTVSAPVAAPVATNTRKKCGLFGLSVFCPMSACGMFGRLFGMCASHTF